MPASSILWHDYETFGADPQRDRPAQFAAVRTSLDLEPIGEPLVVYCQPSLDTLPDPVACLITGITPQQCQQIGVSEAQFAAQIHEAMAEPQTCCAGYNSIRFDDEFTRRLFFRNFFEPYAREYANGNSRWDLIDLARMCYALRPEGIFWPRREDGSPSFKLGDLTRANALPHAQAHDALSDVYASIALARLLRERQRKLYDWYFELRRKHKATSLLDCANMTPVLHVSQRYPAAQGCLAMVAPLTMHPTQPNAVLVYDLGVPPDALLELSPDEIQERIFTPRGDLPDDVARIPIKAVHVNRCPALAPLSVLKGVDLQRVALDPDACARHLAQLRSNSGLAEKLRTVFGAVRSRDANEDPELSLYSGGFPDHGDRRLISQVRSTPAQALLPKQFPFRDPRYRELLFRYRARNFTESLDARDSARWQEYVQRRLMNDEGCATFTFVAYFNRINELRNKPDVKPGELPLLDALQEWGLSLARKAELSVAGM